MGDSQGQTTIYETTKDMTEKTNGKTMEADTTEKTMEDARIESTTWECETPDTADKSEGRFSYTEVYDYVSKKVYPVHLTKEEEKQALRKRSKFFMAKDNGRLFYIGGKGKFYYSLLYCSYNIL